MLDVDGVLVRGRPADGLSWASNLENDLGLSPADLKRCFFDPFWRDVVVGQIDLMPTLEACLRSLPGAPTARDLVAYWFENDSGVDQDILADCDTLRSSGMMVILATNQDHLRAQYLITQLGLGEHVDAIAYSGALRAQKPEAAFFHAAGRMAGLSRDQIILIDAESENVDGARAFGWRAERWTGNSNLFQIVQRSSPPKFRDAATPMGGKILSQRRAPKN